MSPAVLLIRANPHNPRLRFVSCHKSKTGDIEAYDDVNEDGERKPFRPR